MHFECKVAHRAAVARQGDPAPNLQCYSGRDGRQNGFCCSYESILVAWTVAWTVCCSLNTFKEGVIMKADRLIIVSVALVVIIFIACGGGGGDNGTGDTNAQADPAKAIVEQENENAAEFASQAISFLDALEELEAVIEEETAGVGLDGMTVDHMVSMIGQERVDRLADLTNSITSEKIIPTFEAMSTAYDEWVLAEQEYADFLNPQDPQATASTLIQPTGDPIFTPTVIVCASGGVLLSFAGTYIFCGDEIMQAYNACKQNSLAQHPEWSESLAGLTCVNAYMKTLEGCFWDFGASVGTTIGSVATTGFQLLQLPIDSYSAYDAVGKIKRIFGWRSDGTTNGFTDTNKNESMIAVSAFLNPSANFFIGTSEDGTFLVPEGDWTFMAMAEGYARGITDVITVSGDEEIISESVTMVPSDECARLGGDADGDGYTLCQGDCDDDRGSIFPGATEICDDGIDNDCDAVIDCADTDCDCSGDDEPTQWGSHYYDAQWYDAIDFCESGTITEGLPITERLPTIAELQSAYDDCLIERGLSDGESCAPEGFYDTNYWSSETVGDDYAKVFNFHFGSIRSEQKDWQYENYRAVRTKIS